MSDLELLADGSQTQHHFREVPFPDLRKILREGRIVSERGYWDLHQFNWRTSGIECGLLAEQFGLATERLSYPRRQRAEVPNPGPHQGPIDR